MKKFLRSLTERQRMELLVLSAMYVITWTGILTGVFDRFPFVDVPLHFLGGFFVGLFCIDVFRKALVVERGVWRDAVIIVGPVLIVGVLWEAHEYILTLTVGRFVEAVGVTCCIGSLFDTLKDLILDMLGALAMLFLVRRRNPRSPLFW